VSVVFSVAAYLQAAFVILALLAAISLGAGAADIFYSIFVVCAKTNRVCYTASLAVLFTWLGSGVWASIFVSCIIIILLAVLLSKYFVHMW